MQIIQNQVLKNKWGDEMRTKAAFITILFSLITVLSACGADNQTTGAEQKKVQTITVGTGTQFPNICFIDEKAI